jgi:hypothetical protein
MSLRGRRNFSLIMITAGLFATPVNSFGADPVSGYSTAIAVPSQAAPAARRAIPAHPIDPPNTNLDRSMQRARTADRLYEEVMHTSGCFLVARNAAITGGC